MTEQLDNSMRDVLFQDRRVRVALQKAGTEPLSDEQVQETIVDVAKEKFPENASDAKDQVIAWAKDPMVVDYVEELVRKMQSEDPKEESAPGQEQMEGSASKKADAQGKPVEVAPNQQAMTGGEEDMVELERAALELQKRPTVEWDEHLVFHQADWGWCFCIDIFQEYFGCCFYKQFRVTNKGLKIYQKHCCGHTVTNVDGINIENVDKEADCCNGYVHVGSRHSDKGDFALKVRRGAEHSLHEAMLNLSAGAGYKDEKQLIRAFGEPPTCLEPFACLACCGLKYQITDKALRIKDNRFLPCLGYKAKTLRWVNKAGTDVVTDMDSETCCCYGYVNVYTQDNDPDFHAFQIRVRSDELESVMNDLLSLNGSAAGREDTTYSTYMEAGCCCGLLDRCTPACCRLCETKYIVTERGLTRRAWTPCSTSNNYTPWRNVLDVDSREACCTGYLDLQLFDQNELEDLELHLQRKDLKAMYDIVKNKKNGLRHDEEDPILNHFKEANWCPCWNMCCCLPNRYLIRSTGLEVVQTLKGLTTRDHAAWNKFQDVDYHTTCCFGYVDIESVDDEFGNRILRVRKRDADRISRHILNRIHGLPYDAPNVNLSSYRKADCAAWFCPCLCGEFFNLTDRALRVRKQGLCSVDVDNIPWSKIRDVDGQSGCCFGYVDVSFSDFKQRANDRDQGEEHTDHEVLDHINMRVCLPSFNSFFRAVKNMQVGLKFDEEAHDVYDFAPRTWCLMCFCYQGYCWCWNPIEYEVARTGFQEKRFSCTSSKGCCISDFNFMPWVSIREVNVENFCCSSVVDIHTMDDEAPHIVVPLTKGEVDEVASIIRRRGMEKEKE